MNAASESNEVAIVQLVAEDHAELREVRLRALFESPTAFGSSYDVESALDESAWRDKARTWTDPERCATWVVRRGTLACGITACVIDQEHHDRGWLVSVWVDPAVRRLGLAGRLLDTAVDWAERMELAELRLHVTSNNRAARELYEANGFIATGDSMPHPRFDELIEWEMRRVLKQHKGLLRSASQDERGVETRE
ncbi:MAG: GNAT family N-acetyltransferase [Planctomycetota bacterium]